MKLCWFRMTMSANKVDVDDTKVVTAASEAKTKRRFKFRKCILKRFPNTVELKQYLGVIVCGLAIWGWAYFIFGSYAVPGGYIFDMAGVVVLGYVAGHALENFTTVPALVGMTVVGALCRNLGLTEFHMSTTANAVDYHLRRIYPVIILTKGPFGWDFDYIKSNYTIVFSLAIIPWIVEWISMTTVAFYVLDLPWIWGIHLGSIIASVSPAVVVPTASRLAEKGYGVKNEIAKLVGCAGGLDTAFTEGMFGVINAAIFVEATDSYRIVKGVLAIFVGIILGVCWGVLVDFIPDHQDPLAATIKSFIIFWGGLLLMYSGGYFGWGGTAGVAVMVGAATAATRWARRGWPINKHPVAVVYRVLWTILEPMLFTFSGYFLEVEQIDMTQFLQIIFCILVALIMRLVTAFLVSLACSLSIKESLFISVTWIPKAIVEAVLVRVAFDSLSTDASEEHKKYAQIHVNMIVIAIVLTSSLGSVLTTVLGPVLLKRDLKPDPADVSSNGTRQSTPKRGTTA